MAINEYQKRYREKNKERIKEYQKKYYAKNKEKLDERSKQWHRDNPDYKKEYYQKNKELVDARNKEWQKKNKKRYIELCNESRKRRVERMRAEGIKNAWDVINKGVKPKYAYNNNKED